MMNLDQSLIASCHEAGRKIASDTSEWISTRTTVSVERATARIMSLVADFRSFAPIEVDIADRRQMRESFPPPRTPLRYVLTATGDIDQDITHALAVAEAGGDIIAVIRSTAQSLLDYVPEGKTHEGYGGTFATQANMRAMREALDDWSEKNGRYIRLSNFASGLCMPEIAAIGAIEGLDNMVADAMYGILYRDINMQRTLIDQKFARRICAWAGMTINTGEDNYFRTSDQLLTGHTAIASNFINYWLATDSGLRDAQIGLGSAFEINPKVPSSLAYHIADALLLRELFPDCPTKFMPPTAHMDGNHWKTHGWDQLFNAVCGFTRQGIMTIGDPFEGTHTPTISSRVYALQGVEMTLTACDGLWDDLEVVKGGRIWTRATETLGAAEKLLGHVADVGLMQAVEDKTFGNTHRSRDGGKGLDGVIEKVDGYRNPVEDVMLAHA